jgi:dTDP-4-amino-4,6-dideoxygalactose transaminase
VTKSQRIIGGGFGLAEGTVTPAPTPAFLAEPRLLLATARSAFMLLEEHLRPEQVWLPSYLCTAVLQAFPKEQPRIRFYAVNQHLRPANDSWLREIRPGDMVVFIDYFGFTGWSEYAKEARRSGAWVVEDACQAMLNDQFGKDSQYVIVSPRKFVGVPDGGILLARNGATLPEGKLPPPPAVWWLEALAATQLRAEFDRHGGERAWFPLFQKTDDSAPSHPMRMSELSSLLLWHRIDYNDIVRRRRDNYRLLATELKHLAIFPELPPGVTPLGFPVRIQDRARVQRALFDADIYPPVHWPIAGAVPEEFKASHQLSAEILTLPCDQRYDDGSMTKMARCLKAANPSPLASGSTA